MKTIAFNRSRGSILTTVLVLGGLVGFYYYRAKGGKLIPLLTGAIGSVKSIANHFASAENDAEELVGGVVSGSSATSKRKTSRSVSTSPEDLDRLPAT